MHLKKIIIVLGILSITSYTAESRSLLQYSTEEEPTDSQEERESPPSPERRRQPEERREINSELQALVFKPISRSPISMSEIFRQLGIGKLFRETNESESESPTSVDFESFETIDSESEEYEGGTEPAYEIEEETSQAPSYVENVPFEGDYDITETEEELLNPNHVKSEVTPDVTPEGIDPKDPEEIARKEAYSHKAPFDQITDINKRLNVAGLFEGDVKRIRNRNAAGGADKWSKTKFGINAGLVLIPYKIAHKYNRTHLGVIKSAMSFYTKHTCIRFVPRRTEIAYIFISDGRGCWAFVGKTGQPAQTVSLGIPGCISKGIVAHELMHVVGFQHEHSRSDRDQFVKILPQNIKRDMLLNFERYNDTKNLVIYDYNSVMHYSKKAFSKKTYLPSIQIAPKRQREPDIGQRERLSPYDIEEINYLYDCKPGTYQRCGRDFKNEAQNSFSSPQLPNKSYPKESHCVWNITVRRGLYVKVTFKNINIADSTLCQKDAILIHDGINAASPVLKTICGKHSSDIEVVSSGRSLYIIFSSDPIQVSNAGFSAVFTEISTPGQAPVPFSIPTLPPITDRVNDFACDFDNGMCAMTQDNLDRMDWLRISGPTLSQSTGPTADHTSGRGHYIFVESSLPARAGDNAIVRTPWFFGDTPYCATFSYHMLGGYMGTLRLYAFEKRTTDGYGHEVLLWEKSGNQGRNWINQQIFYSRRKNVESVQFYWEAYIFYYQSDIAIDDIQVRVGGCRSGAVSSTSAPRLEVWTTNRKPTTVRPTTAKKSSTTTLPQTTTTKPTTTTRSSTASATPVPIYSSINCTFDNDLCGWTQSITDNFDWTHKTGPTPSHNTGPAADHTSGSGKYLFIEASSPRREGYLARLISPKLTPRKHCVHMWYHMYGKQIGTLMISQVVDSVPSELMKLIGNKGDSWISLSVEVDPGVLKKSSQRTQQQSDTPYIESEEENEEQEETSQDNRHQVNNVRTVDIAHDSNVLANRPTGILKSYPDIQVVIEATRAGGYAGDIGIDDVVITDGPCASPSAVVSAPTLYSNFSCDFDQPHVMCGMEQSTTDYFDWTPNSGFTSSTGTGPSTDNTKKNESGVYLYLESSSPRKSNDMAEIKTPHLVPGQYCVRFFTHMYGSAMGDIEIFSLEERTDDLHDGATPISQWALSGDHGNLWEEHSFNFKASDKAKWVRFLFQGKIGTGFTSDLAMDDISITQGNCISKTVAGNVTTTTKSVATTTAKSTTTTTVVSSTIATTNSATTNKEEARTVMATSSEVTTTAPATNATTAMTIPAINATTTTTTIPAINASTTTTPSTTTRPVTTTTTITTTPITTTQKIVTRTLHANIFPSAFSCDFESEVFCGMAHTNLSLFDWQRHHGRTPSAGTGPTSDHTFGLNSRGNYIYLEATTPRQRKDYTMITTPSLAVQGRKRCVTFWYHMWGNGMGNMRVYADFTPSTRSRKSAQLTLPRSDEIFMHNAGDNRTWNLAEIEVVQDTIFLGGSVKIRFRGERGRTFQSDMAIDDICITEGPCAASYCLTTGSSMTTVASTTRVLSTTTVPPTTSMRTTAIQPSTIASTTTKAPASTASIVAAPVPTPNSVSRRYLAGVPLCTFEDPSLRSSRLSNRPPPPDANKKDLGNMVIPRQFRNDPLCGWRQVRGRDQFNWTRHSGPTNSRGTGPQGDHTTTRGHYMYIEASAPRKENDVALLQTYRMRPANYCVDVHYHMHGVFIGRLAVRSLQKLNNGRHVLSYLKNEVGNHGKQWKRIRVNYRPWANAQSTVFRLEGVVGNDYRSDIAIDDAAILPGKCDACSTPSHRFINSLNQEQTFTTGCVDTTLFWVRRCSLTQEKAIYRRVSQCNANMFSAARLNWYCNYF